MSSWFESAITWWHARSGRERILLLVLGGVLGGTIAWYGMAAPLRRLAASAERHHAQAAQQLAEIEAAVHAIKAAESPSKTGAPLDEAAMESAKAAGLSLDASSAGNGQEITVSARNANPAVLFQWIEALRRNYGILITNLTVSRSEDSTVKMEARLSRGGN